MSHAAPTPKMRSSVRHTRAIQYDRTKQPKSLPLAPELTAQVPQLLHPHTLAQVAHFQRLGLCARLLTSPVTVALVLTS